jgi:citrate lyase subunit beta/citryl-CoA lyase
MSQAPLQRALLFVPGHRADRFDKALAAGASAVIVDLEDAVAPADKDAARATLAGWLSANAGPQHQVIVRINSADTPWFAADLALCSAPGVAGVMLPKAERPETLAQLRAAGARGLLPLVESAAGIANLDALARAPGVWRLAFGSIDLQVDLGLKDATEDELLPFRLQLVLASRLAGIGAPVDGVSTAIDDADRLQQDVARARRLGFAGKLCIHPKQVALVQAGMAPSAAELAWARRVIDASAAAGGAENSSHAASAAASWLSTPFTRTWKAVTS